MLVIALEVVRVERSVPSLFDSCAMCLMIVEERGGGKQVRRVLGFIKVMLWYVNKELRVENGWLCLTRRTFVSRIELLSLDDID